SLVYSGNFEASMEVTPHNLLRFMMGINSFDFYWNLEKKSEFVTPEVILSYSEQGLNKLSQNIHHLINNNLIKPDWQNHERPVLLNNWEATSFSFNERKLLKLAKAAKKLGIELFVLDDGWFGKRDSDTSSLGDWYPNRKKLPSGISGLCRKVNEMGLAFGIWVEPEMVNPDSDLFRLHPDWAISHPDYEPSLGRNQLILDLANPEVCEYLFDVLSALLASANISYCKWDMNRNFSDVYSRHLPKEEQGSLYHRYYLGLYDLLEKLTKKFPKVLFEACASGGNRFDMGMLYYMPQIWTSDNTDGYERLKIQFGTSMCYPQSVMGAHVSNIPNMQTLRQTPLETRFNTASIGLLGYELDITKITSFEKKVIQKQIAFYKEHRKLLQFGRLTRIKNPFANQGASLMVTSQDKKAAILGVYQALEHPNGALEKIRVRDLDDEKEYLVKNRKQYFNLSMFGDLVRHALPIKISQNSIWFHLLKNRYLMQAESECQSEKGLTYNQNGFIPKQNFIGTGYNEHVRLMGDFGSRLYVFKEKENQEA
ncbi:MAG: alpha-galactosidase, partial [Candidatus Izemoplasmatales bacterium]|nr:alpha-galactosidase [Candidatus Izemoplasmatales bacterium]